MRGGSRTVLVLVVVLMVVVVRWATRSGTTGGWGLGSAGDGGDRGFGHATGLLSDSGAPLFGVGGGERSP